MTQNRKPISRTVSCLTTAAMAAGFAAFAPAAKADDIQYTWNGHTYAVIEQAMTPIEAKAYCEAQGGYLASVTSQEEQDYLASVLADYDYEDFWIGASDDGSEGDWYWMNGEPWDFTAWYPGGTAGSEEPNNGLGWGENYACMNRSRDYQWADGFGGYDSYSSTACFICEWDSKPQRVFVYNGHTYSVIEEAVTPIEAKAYCEAQGGYLATVTSQEEQDFIASMLAEYDYEDFWIGASDDGSEGNWYWMNGEPWGFTAWYPGGTAGSEEPNNGLGWGEDYAHMNRSRDYQWVDGFGRYDGYTATAYFICEWGDPPFPEVTLPGDVNADGSVSVMDAVLLQRWLVRVSGTVLTNWKNGDMNGDNRLDIADLCLLKYALTGGVPAVTDSVTIVG